MVEVIGGGEGSKRGGEGERSIGVRGKEGGKREERGGVRGRDEK